MVKQVSATASLTTESAPWPATVEGGNGSGGGTWGYEWEENSEKRTAEPICQKQEGQMLWNITLPGTPLCIFQSFPFGTVLRLFVFATTYLRTTHFFHRRPLIPLLLRLPFMTFEERKSCGISRTLLSSTFTSVKLVNIKIAMMQKDNLKNKHYITWSP